MSEIKLMKLTTGEEILAEIVSEDGNSLTIKNCVAIVLNPSREGISYGFMPWGNLSKEDKTIVRTNVIYSATPNDDIRSSYSSMFGGIVTPPKHLIV
jgi:hypothetical protein